MSGPAFDPYAEFQQLQEHLGGQKRTFRTPPSTGGITALSRLRSGPSPFDPGRMVGTPAEPIDVPMRSQMGLIERFFEQSDAQRFERRRGQLNTQLRQMLPRFSDEPDEAYEARLIDESNRIMGSEGAPPDRMENSFDRDRNLVNAKDFTGVGSLYSDSEFGTSVQRGAFNTAGGLVGGTLTGAGSVINQADRAFIGSFSNNPIGNALINAGQGVKGYFDTANKGAAPSTSIARQGALPDSPESIGRWLVARGPETTVQVAGTIAPGMAAGRAAGAVGMSAQTASRASIAASMSAGAAMETAEIYSTALELGASESDAEQAALAHAVVVSLLEKLPADKVFGLGQRGVATQGVVNRAYKQALAEAATEAPQELSGAVNAYLASGNPEALDEMFERTAAAGILSLLPGGLTGATQGFVQGDPPFTPSERTIERQEAQVVEQAERELADRGIERGGGRDQTPASQEVAPEATEPPAPAPESPVLVADETPVASEISGPESELGETNESETGSGLQIADGDGGQLESRIRLADGRDIPAKYRVVDASELIPSHDARRGFARNEDGDLNERPYDDPNAGDESRRRVQEIADGLEPSLLLTDTPVGTEGPPIVRPSNVVLGGNARSMALQLAYQRGGESAQRYRQAVLEQAEQFGVSREQVEGVQNPVLVREISDEDAGAPGQISRVLNESTATVRSPVADAVSRGQQLDQQALQTVTGILGDGTLRDALGDQGRQNRILQTFVDAGAISQQEVGAYLQNGLLTPTGKELVENALLGSAVSDTSVLSDTAPSVRNTLLRSLPQIQRLRAPAGENDVSIDFETDLRDALEGAIVYRETGARSVNDLLGQASFTPEAFRDNPRAIGLLRSLVNDTPTTFRNKLADLAEAVENEASGQASMFGATDPAQAVQDAIEANFPSGIEDDVAGGVFASPPRTVPIERAARAALGVSDVQVGQTQASRGAEGRPVSDPVPGGGTDRGADAALAGQERILPTEQAGVPDRARGEGAADARRTGIASLIERIRSEGFQRAQLIDDPQSLAAGTGVSVGGRNYVVVEHDNGKSLYEDQSQFHEFDTTPDNGWVSRPGIEVIDIPTNGALPIDPGSLRQPESRVQIEDEADPFEIDPFAEFEQSPHHGIKAMFSGGGPARTPPNGALNRMSRFMPNREQAMGWHKVMQSLLKVPEAAGVTVPIRAGSFNSRVGGAKALGVFKLKPFVIRVAQANDISTAAHEVGHAVHRILFVSPNNKAKLKPMMERDGVRQELVAMGKDLYGNVRPNGGYASEGWAELFSFYVMGDDATLQTKAPKTLQMLNGAFARHFPEVKAALDQSREQAINYQSQTAEQRAKGNIRKARKSFRRVLDSLAGDFQTNYIDSFTPLFKLEDQARKMLAMAKDVPEKGVKLPTSVADMASWLRMGADAVLESFVEQGVTDFARNVTDENGDSLGPSLRMVGKLVGRKNQQDFAAYLWARRTVSLRTDPRGERDTGMSMADAREIIDTMEGRHRNFARAAQMLYEWNKGVLEYAADSSPMFREMVDRIYENDPGDYIPLWRVFEDDNYEDPLLPTGAGSSTKGGIPIKSLKGSERQIQNPLDTVLLNARRIVESSHNRHVIDQLLRMSEIPGMGALVEEVPRTLQPMTRDAGDVLDALKSAVGEFELVDKRTGERIGQEEVEGNLVTMFMPARLPNTKEPVFPVHTAEGIKWYRMSREIGRVLDDLDPSPDIRWGGNGVNRLLNALLYQPNRIFRLGVTGTPVFAARNTIRDFNTFIAQSQSDASTLSLASSWARGMVDSASSIRSPESYAQGLSQAKRLGVTMAQRFNAEQRNLNRVHREVYGQSIGPSTPLRVLDKYLEVIQVPEAASRIAEVRERLQDMGLNIGDRLTLNEAMIAGLAGKQVTTDFTAAGRHAREINKFFTFFNVSIQGPRVAARVLKKNPARSVRMAVLLTLPSIALALSQRDEEWYKELSPTDRTLYWHIPVETENGVELVKIPKPFEWGAAFATIPVAVMDQAIQKDRNIASELGAVFDTMSPIDMDMPLVGLPLLKLVIEQTANRDFFFDSPIVSDGMKDTDPSEQVTPYTTKLAAWLGDNSRVLDKWYERNAPSLRDATGNVRISPVRVDHAIRAMTGGMGQQALDVTGLGRQERGGPELAKLPVVGAFFKRGGAYGGQSASVQWVYKERDEARWTAGPDETRVQRERRLLLEDAASCLSAISTLMQHGAPTLSERQEMSRLRVEVAREARQSLERGVFNQRRTRAGFRRQEQRAEREADRAREANVSP